MERSSARVQAAGQEATLAGLEAMRTTLIETARSVLNPGLELTQPEKLEEKDQPHAHRWANAAPVGQIGDDPFDGESTVPLHPIPFDHARLLAREPRLTADPLDPPGMFQDG